MQISFFEMCFVSVYFGDGIGAILFARRASLLNCRVRFPMTCQPLPTYPTARPFTESLFSVFRGVSGSKLCCAEAILALLQSLHDWGIKLNPEPQTINTAWERCETVIPYISYTMSRGLCSQMAWEGYAMVGSGWEKVTAGHELLTRTLRASYADCTISRTFILGPLYLQQGGSGLPQGASEPSEPLFGRCIGGNSKQPRGTQEPLGRCIPRPGKPL